MIANSGRVVRCRDARASRNLLHLGPPRLLKLALITVSAVRVTVQLLFPLQPPLQPKKADAVVIVSDSLIAGQSKIERPQVSTDGL